MRVRLIGSFRLSLAVVALGISLCAPSWAQESAHQFARRSILRQPATSGAPTAPISAGNWSQIAELVSSTSQPLFPVNTSFGELVSISGNTILATIRRDGVQSGR
jgi:hypothetical protein